jgi:hypothetical protein
MGGRGSPCFTDFMCSHLVPDSLRLVTEGDKAWNIPAPAFKCSKERDATGRVDGQNK